MLFCSVAQFSWVQLLSRVQLFVTPWITAYQATLSITNSWSLLKLMSIKLVIPSSHLILCSPFFSCPQSLPASGSLPMNHLCSWGGQSIGVQSSVQFPNHVQFFVTPWTGAHQPPCPSPSPEFCPSSCPLHWWCHPAISSSDTLFFCPQCFPESGTFPKNHLFVSDEKNTRVSASASILQKCIQNWFPFRLTGLISLLSKGFSGVFSSPTIQRHQFFSALLYLPSSPHNITWPLAGP